MTLAVVYRGRIRAARQLPRRNPADLVVQPRRAQDAPVTVEGSINFRDVGGYRTADGQIVQTGIVFRSGALSALTDAGMQTLLDLNVKQVFDLRLDSEVLHYPDRLPEGVHYQRTPIVAGSRSLGRLVALFRHIDRVPELVVLGYTKGLLDIEARPFAELISAIAEGDGAAVIHCTAGKDRTGTFCAVLLSTLGVPDEIIAADYSLSNLYYDAYLADATAQMKPLARLGIQPDALHDMLVADPNYILRTLAYLRETYGGAEQYLLKAGMKPETLHQLKARLLVTPESA